MSKAEEYLAKSLQLWAEAEAATDPLRRSDLEWLANSYRLLAEHAHDEESNIIYLPDQPNTQQQQPEQQQQGKLEPEE
jgi:hypothetical protein